MGKSLFIASTVIVLVSLIAWLVGRSRESSKTERLLESLTGHPLRPATGVVDFRLLSALPPPVVRYFRHVLSDGQELIRTATIRQTGVLRTSAATEKWSPFTALQQVVPPAPGFVWNARVEMPLAAHVRVVDSYVAGAGAGRVSLLSALAVASEGGVPELTSGALHRYLAEAAWFPTALLPQSGVVWTPIDDRAALATLTDAGTTVSLEFRFNEAGEAVGIYSPGRFGRFDGEYKRLPWEGHFRDYRLRSGMRVPTHGEVGWYVDGSLQIVWEADCIEMRYELGW